MTRIQIVFKGAGVIMQCQKNTVETIRDVI